MADPAASGLAGRIFILDDHRIFLDTLRHYFKDSAEIDVVGATARGPAAYAQIAALQPDVVVVDPGPRLDDVAPTVALVRQAAPRAALIALSFSYDADYAAVAQQAGVDVYIDKAAAADDLLAAVLRLTGRG